MQRHTIIADSEDLQRWRSEHPESLLVVGFEFHNTIYQFESDSSFAANNAVIVLRKAGIRASTESDD